MVLVVQYPAPHWSVVTRAIVSRAAQSDRTDHSYFQQLDVTGEKEEAEEAAQRERDQPQREREQRQQRPEQLRSV